MAVSVAVCEIFSVIFANMLDTHKTRMTRLPCGEETMTICLAVLIEYRNVTDRQTDGQNCDFENRVRVRSRSLEMAPFHRSRTSSY